MLSTFRPMKHHSKGQALCAQLTDMAHELGPQGKFPRVLDLCETLGVSMTTMNSALSEMEARRVIERRHGVGIFVSRHLHQKSIGLVCDPSFFRPGTSPFWQQFIEGARSRAASKDEVFRFYMALGESREGLPVHDDLAEDVKSGRLGGVLFVGNNLPAVEWLGAQGLPVVTFAGEGPHSVRIKYSALVEIAVKNLKKCGCKKLSLLLSCERQDVERAATSLIGLQMELANDFRRSLARHKMEFQDTRVWCAATNQPQLSGESHQEQGYAAVMELFGDGKKSDTAIDGLVIPNDMMTRGALVAMQKLGLQLNRDVFIASHHNRGSSVLHGYENDLTTIEIDPAEVIHTIFETLESLMSGAPVPATTWVGPAAASA